MILIFTLASEIIRKPYFLHIGFGCLISHCRKCNSRPLGSPCWFLGKRSYLSIPWCYTLKVPCGKAQRTWSVVLHLDWVQNSRTLANLCGRLQTFRSVVTAFGWQWVVSAIYDLCCLLTQSLWQPMRIKSTVFTLSVRTPQLPTTFALKFEQVQFTTRCLSKYC